MKNFTLFAILLFLSTVTFGQQVTFNWVEETISAGNNLQGMTITENPSSAVIIGYDNTFKKIADGQMTDVVTFEPEYNFIGLSSGQNTTVFTSRKAKVVDHPSGGKPDVYVSGIMMKSSDNGSSWELMDVSAIGTGDDPATNPNTVGSYAKDIYAVGVYNNDTMLVYIDWYDISSGSNETRGAIFRTNDGGTSWEPIITDLGNKFITTIKVQDSMAYVGGNNKLLATNLNTNEVVDLYPKLAVDTDSNLYVNSIVTKTAQEFYAVTTTDGIFKTVDGGQSFSRINDFGGANDLCIVNDSTLLVLGNASKSKVTTDNGTTWTDCYPGKTCYAIGGILGDTLYGMANTDACVIAVSDLINKDFNWSTIELNPGANLQKMEIFDGNSALIIGFSEMCKTTADGGQSWQTATLPTDLNEDVEFDFSSISNN